ncbi:hypothetical protein R5W23_001718 [Gemmata sp. JC673]|uniref:Uncharacterized protein n=1 Tax=Gemmata algarum TaxID=2975278 RepID=A0ABU5EZX5_9BACT|nr:hypothetical protein [Gemmata algarum]MDY3560483.1 hypothetical protein [Gemmata algarum]
MSVLKLKCPECRAGLKSGSGFKVGQTVCCPKCETYFVVEDPDEGDEPAKPRAAVKAVRAAVADEDDEEERTLKKKKKRRAADDEGSYKNSPLRFVILGVLVVIMLVLAFFLYKKKQSEAAEGGMAPEDIPPVDVQPVPGGKMASKLTPPAVNVAPPGAPKRPTDLRPSGAPSVALNGGVVAPAEAKRLVAKHTAALVGTWAADLGSGTREQLTYTADGSYTVSRTGSGAATAGGQYEVKGLVGTKGLKLLLTGTSGERNVIVIFEDDELHHPSLEQGVTAVFRKVQ